MTDYRVWMHTRPSPGSTYYDGYVDVWADGPERAEERAKREAHRGGLYNPANLVVDKIESLRRS